MNRTSDASGIFRASASAPAGDGQTSGGQNAFWADCSAEFHAWGGTPTTTSSDASTAPVGVVVLTGSSINQR